MSASSSSSSSSSSPSPSDPSEIFSPVPFPTLTMTREEFNSFHKIDRNLFAKLVLHLGRDWTESARVVAFLLWLENSGQAPRLVSYILSLDDSFVSALADEAVLCLKCMEGDDFATFFNSSIISNDTGFAPLIRSVTRDKLTLRFFFENRKNIFAAVIKNFNEVCMRAFRDILVVAARSREMRAAQEKKKCVMVHDDCNNWLMTLPTYYNPPRTPFRPPYHYASYGGGSLVPQGARIPMTAGSNSGGSGSEPPVNESLKLVPPEDALSQALSQVKIGDTSSGGGCGGKEGKLDDFSQTSDAVPQDDRTIFLTFSKGYPISETEVIEFFTRKFGDCVEAAYMQEVTEEEQPLFARLVLNRASMMRAVLGKANKAKYTINGKHVWARKYIRKLGPSSPSRSQPDPA